MLKETIAAVYSFVSRVDTKAEVVKKLVYVNGVAFLQKQIAFFFKWYSFASFQKLQTLFCTFYLLLLVGVISIQRSAKTSCLAKFLQEYN